MFKPLLRLGLVLLALNIDKTLCDSWFPDRGEASNYEGTYVPRQRLWNIQESLASLDPYSRGLGLSAWGIIAVVVLIILAIVTMYYISICYPVMCKKTRKYDNMRGLAPPPV